MCLSDRPTPRQLEVIRLAGCGNTQSEIAKMMMISVPGVERHSTDCRRLLNARNMTHAVVICLAKGYLELGDDGLPAIVDYGSVLTTV